MMINSVFSGLNIGTALASPGDPNFLPDSWPPAPDFPICLSPSGDITARYGDDTWDLTHWAGYVLKLRFGISKRKDSPYVSPANAETFKQVVAYWIYGPKACREVRTLHNQFEILKQVFVHCSKHGIDATELYRYPKVIESLGKEVWPSQASRLVFLLHNLWDHRDHAGLYILDADGIAALAANIPDHQKSQTAYIPPRIWLYQLVRLREFLLDFETHLEDIKSCSEFCLQAYATSAGSLAEACSYQLPEYRKPFVSISNPKRTGIKSGAIRLGPFYQTAERFNILPLLEKWCGNVNHAGITILTQYFSMATNVGKAYLLNFSLMRIDEAGNLRSNCLAIEKDVITNEDIYLLKGATTKTVADDDAYWITSPTSALAIKVMSVVSEFRMRCAINRRQLSLSEESLINPYLELRPYEPWGRQDAKDHAPETRSEEMKYGTFLERYPNLLDKDVLRLTEGDLSSALLITPTLSPSKYSVGKVWPLAWHQLRRTGAVNMNASGIVGESSIQYQLKHLTRSMTRYYGSGSYHLEANLNEEAKAEYIRAMYESVAKNFASFTSPSFVSPHGEKRKEQLINIVSVSDHKKLVKAAKDGSIVYREIMFGACANPDPCPYGGIDYVGRCGGGDGLPACLDLLIDKNKKTQIQQLTQILSHRLSAAGEGTPMHTSIKYQLTAAESTLNVIENS
jgi:hypothetical protein